jgi:hypothetical protein
MNTVNALKAALPTSRHAEMLLEAVTAALGNRAHIETANEGQRTQIFVRDRSDREWIVPWPLLQFSRGRRLAHIIGAEGPPTDATPPAGDGPPPRLRHLTAGELAISDGIHEVAFTYGEDGRVAEVMRSGPEESLAAAGEALGRGSGNAVEVLADHLAGLDIGRVGPGRVLLPPTCPTTVGGAWSVSLSAIRDGLLDGGVDPSARRVGADGYVGSVLRMGADRREVFGRCREGIERLRPCPPKPKPPPTPEAMAEMGVEGFFMLTGPTPDAPRVEPSPENTPVGMTSLAPLPDAPPPFGCWMHLLDDRGASSAAIMLREESGLLVVGARALRVPFDPASLHAMLDDADRVWDRVNEDDAWEWPSGLPALDSEARSYSLQSGSDGTPRFRVEETAKSHGFFGRVLRPETKEGGVMRQRWVK